MSIFRGIVGKEGVLFRSLSTVVDGSGGSGGGGRSKFRFRGLRTLVVAGLVVGGYAGYIYAWREDLFNFKKGKEKKQKLVVLGSGWGAIAMMRKIDQKLYDVCCISPRNYFLMTVRI